MNKNGRGWTLRYLFSLTWSVYITNFQLKYNFKISLKNKNKKLARKIMKIKNNKKLVDILKHCEVT